MSNIFLGKFSSKFPEQIQKKFYSAGVEGGVWYGGVQIGDYVFAAYEGKIIGLWRAKEYTRMKNSVNPQNDGVLAFEEMKDYEDIGVVNHFIRYKYFVHNINLLNKVTKSVRNLGFIPILTRNGCPNPEDIDFKSGTINIYVALESANIEYSTGDIRVVVNDSEQMQIEKIERCCDCVFTIYEELQQLYEERNKADGRFTIRELSDFAVQDNATNKRKFLIELIEEIENKGFYKVSDAIKLYDNLLVGRKRTTDSSSSDKAKLTVSENIEYVDDEGYIEDEGEYGKFAILLNFNPNIILYGPPGTGKTYATSNIIDTFEKTYYDKRSSYGKARLENRVRDITFHQSYSYEEFIEGIRPALSEEDGNVAYHLENGVFKEFCVNAGKEIIKRKENANCIDKIGSGSIIWKLSLGERKSDTLYNECIQKNEIAIGWLSDLKLDELEYNDIFNNLGKDSGYGEKPTQNANTVNSFVHEMKVGDIVLIYNSPETIRKIGIVGSEYFHTDGLDYTHRRKVEWIDNLNYPINIKKYNDNTLLTLKTLYRFSRMTVDDVVRMITEHSVVAQSSEDKHQIKPYYIVIDEINRGNISKIFGELITLIEQDKRGKETMLPYSKKTFSVPPNLYIIGTMNTADRSIAALDTALRRRFSFVEVEPDSSILLKKGNNFVDSIDLVKLMDKLNEKIISKYDRDHRIGHAYFMDINSLNSLYQAWYYKIMPLLAEYFYNDVVSLQEIAGKGLYDNNGNIKFLSKSKDTNGKSEFEVSLETIYKR